MATLAPSQQLVHRPNRLYDRVFFSGMSLVMLGTVLFGFAKTYFLAGMVRAPLPNVLIHIHGAAFTLWIALLLVQTALIATRNVRVHRVLGLWGFGLAATMIVLGLLAAVDQLRRGGGPPSVDPKTFFIIPLSDIALFALFVYFAYRSRSKPEAHKRLILIATIVLVDAAVARWPIAILQEHPPLEAFVLFGYLLMIVAFDLFSLRRFSRTTLWASAVFVVVFLTRVPLGSTAAWHSFARAAGGH